MKAVRTPIAALLLLTAQVCAAQPRPSLPWNIKRVGAPKAWPKTTGKGVKVCVLDTGADLSHEGLRIAGGFNAVAPNKPFQDGHGHGTHVTGTIAAQDVGRGVIGVAPDAEIYAVKVLNDRGFGTFTSIIAGLQWCVENGMHIANVSLGAPIASEAYKDAIQSASAAGLTIVAAAGNSGSPESGGSSVVFPAAYPETIAVSAMDWHDKTADFSSRGPEVDVIAPGVEIRSTKLGGGYTFKDGTSMAAPHVTGLAALYLSAGGERGGERIRDALAASASPIPGTPAAEQGAGVPDASILAGVSSALRAAGYRLEFVSGRGWLCRNFRGEEGLNRLSPAELAKTKDGECADLHEARMERLELSRTVLKGADLVRAKLTGTLLMEADLLAADLREAVLDGADLRGANLEAARLNGDRLNSADLQGAKLVRADLRAAQLIGAKLTGASLYEADLRKAELREASLKGADIRFADFREASIGRADFSGARMTSAKMKGIDLRGSDFQQADMRNIELEGAYLSGSNFFGAKLTGANMRGASARDAQFVDAELRNADLAGAELRRSSFREADLSGANLAGAILTGATFRKARLRGANLENTDLSGAYLTKADLSGASLLYAKIESANLSGARFDRRTLLPFAEEEALRRGMVKLP